jgi:broad specificity phosphatase PhoE
MGAAGAAGATGTAGKAGHQPRHRPALILVRHGETIWSAGGRHTSFSDIPLTEHGRDQARRAGSRLSGHPFARVLTSPRHRAVETCRLTGLGDRAEVDDDLREWDYGDYEGLTSEEIWAKSPGWTLWAEGCPGGERGPEVAARADALIARVRATMGQGDDVIAFAHGHVLRVIGARWAAQDLGVGAALGLSTASISVLGWEHAVPVISRWNDTSHLDGGPPLPVERN